LAPGVSEMVHPIRHKITSDDRIAMLIKQRTILKQPASHVLLSLNYTKNG